MVVGGLAACGLANDVPAEPPVDAGGVDASGDGAVRDGASDSGSDRRDAAPVDAQADGTADAGPPGSPIFLCGGAPYQWLPASQVGGVVERKNVTRHTQLDLTLILAKLRSDGTFKTNRLPKHDVKVDVIRYNTQDRGTLAEATGAVAYPTNRSGDTPVMLLLHGTTGFADGCAPTRTAAATSNPVDAFTQDLPTLLSLFASFGYIVVAPDYLGLKGFGPPSTIPVHPYLVGEPTAIASLDMVRAAKTMLAGEGAVPGKLVVVGGSQGGHAAAFVDRLGPHYAPELPIAGAVWDVPPTDLTAHATHALDADGPATDNIAYFLMASNYWYSRNLQGPDQAFLPPFNRSLTAALPTDCKLDLLDARRATRSSRPVSSLRERAALPASRRSIATFAKIPSRGRRSRGSRRRRRSSSPPRMTRWCSLPSSATHSRSSATKGIRCSIWSAPAPRTPSRSLTRWIRGSTFSAIASAANRCRRRPAPSSRRSAA